ncbi:MAG: hypothetical protein EXR58_07600 [Chloroflexi bacterium]|nr:hypothetical protein [Chloroflexota bacterium]
MKYVNAAAMSLSAFILLSGCAPSSPGRAAARPTQADVGSPVGATTRPGAPAGATSRPQAAPTQPSVGTRQAGNLGAILTRPDGRTLYIYRGDAPNESVNFSGPVATWPPLLSPDGAIQSPNGLDLDLGGLARSDGGLQITYHGWPLYTFSGDRQPGDTSGQGQAAGLWQVAVVNDRPGTQILLAANYGQDPVLTDATGKTLYLFISDDDAVPDCRDADGCSKVWPPLVVPGNPAGSIYLPGKLTSKTRADGRRQVVYNGWPLYRSSEDLQPGGHQWRSDERRVGPREGHRARPGSPVGPVHR